MIFTDCSVVSACGPASACVLYRRVRREQSVLAYPVAKILKKFQWNLSITESQGTRIFSVANRFRFIQGSTGSSDCKSFLLRTVFRYGHVLFKTGFIVLLRISPGPHSKTKTNSGFHSRSRDNIPN